MNVPIRVPLRRHRPLGAPDLAIAGAFLMGEGANAARPKLICAKPVYVGRKSDGPLAAGMVVLLQRRNY